MVTAPAAPTICNSRQHARLGVLADVMVTFGQLGAAAWDKDAVWPDTWGYTYPLCSECWDLTRQVAQRHRPSLVITGTTPPVHPRGRAAAPGCPACSDQGCNAGVKASATHAAQAYPMGPGRAPACCRDPPSQTGGAKGFRRGGSGMNGPASNGAGPACRCRDGTPRPA